MKKQNREFLAMSEKFLIEKLRSAFPEYNVYLNYETGSGIVDIAIPKVKLAISLDGSTFQDYISQKRGNYERDMKIMSLGWKSLRFVDTEVHDNIDSVLETILKQGKLYERCNG